MTSGSYEIGYCSIGVTSVGTLVSFQSVEVPGTNVITADYPLTTVSAFVTAAVLLAPLVQMNWQTSDLSVIPTPITSSATRSTYIPSSIPTSTFSSPRLSTGAKIAIGVTVPVALAFLGLLGFWLLRRRRRRNITTTRRVSIPNTYEPKELQGSPNPSRRTQLDAESLPRELDNLTPRELVGDRPSPHEAHELGI